MNKTFYTRTRILITGGTGSLGRALISKLKSVDADIVVFSRDEGKQAIHFHDSSIKRVIGDVRDIDALRAAFRKYRPTYVIHTAALKRVDDMEYFPDECIKTNINGSQNLISVCNEFNVDKCILVSTDKACMPVNVYGASKFIAERLFVNADHNTEGVSTTKFACVRYGNVIASRGSFIPLWLKTLENGEHVKVTSYDCTRFLFTLNDAVDTVLNALEVSRGGEVFIPMINSYSMKTILDAMSKLLQKHVGSDIIGMRPGEKLHEDMLSPIELSYAYKTKYNTLLCLIPQYSNKSYSDLEKYNGKELNSSLFLNSDVMELTNLIKRGIEEAN